MTPQDLVYELENAVVAGDLQRIDQALAAGADINAPASRTSGCTALQTATGGQLAVFEHLLQRGADVNAVGTDSRPVACLCLTRATDDRFLEIALAAGADMHWRNSSGRTYLHMAASAGRGAAIRLLLGAGLDPNARDQHLNTPLHTLARQGLGFLCPTLVFAGADVDALNARGKRPIDLVDGASQLEVVTMLWALGADAQGCRRDDPGIQSVLEASRLEAAVLTANNSVVAWCLDHDLGITPERIDEAMTVVRLQYPEAETVLRSWKARHEAHAALQAVNAGVQP